MTKSHDKRSMEVLHWYDYLFAKKPKPAGHWKYEIDYRSRGGSLNQYEVRYNAQKETFEGNHVGTTAGGVKQSYRALQKRSPGDKL